jgi:hypothetical protein
MLYPIADGMLWSIGQLNAQGYDIEQTVLVVCPGRGGSTWLAEIVSALQGYVILWEPLHLENNPRCREAGFGWQNYPGSEEDQQTRKEYLRRVYTGRDLSTRTLTSLEFDPSQLINIGGYVVKHVNANMMIHRIMEWFPVRAVLMIRHPCAAVSSQLEHGGWTHLSKEDITIPDGLFADFPHLEQVFEGLSTLEEFLAFEWAIQTYVPLSQPTPHPWYLTTYERLVVDGRREVERIFDYLETPVPPSAIARLEEPSATTGEESHIEQNKNRLTGWTERLNQGQVSRILETSWAVGVRCYSESLTPNEESLPLPPEQPSLFGS